MGYERRYERFPISGDERDKTEAIINGELVQLIDFSAGGMYFLSNKSFSKSEVVSISIRFENQVKMDTMGIIARIQPEPEKEMWGVAIDLSALNIV